MPLFQARPLRSRQTFHIGPKGDLVNRTAVAVLVTVGSLVGCVGADRITGLPTDVRQQAAYMIGAGDCVGCPLPPTPFTRIDGQTTPYVWEFAGDPRVSYVLVVQDDGHERTGAEVRLNGETHVRKTALQGTVVGVIQKPVQLKAMNRLTVLPLGAVGATVTVRIAPVTSIDQRQPIIDASAGFVLAIGGGSDQVLAQVFTPGVTGALTSIAVPVSCHPSVSVTVEIRNAAAGVPSTTVLTMETVPGTALQGGWPYPFFRVGFSAPPFLQAGVPAALVLRASGSAVAACSIMPGPVGDPYAGGDGFFDALPNQRGVWVPLSVGTSRRDLPFQTWMH